ncbi:MAG: NUDIX domain-containing protein [Erysipelotrichaceae bacterium]|nr:NUDIX domain-containing protein [Erysipelotrichaceae bacterium]
MIYRMRLVAKMKWNEFLAKVLAISRIGLKFSKDPYALENYEELQSLALNQLKEHQETPDDALPYQRDIYPTPNISVRIIILNQDNELLMGQERSDGAYAVPGGWCDVFESASDNARKEVLQETGLSVRIDKVLCILRRDLYREYASMISEYVIYFSATVLSGELQNNHEILSLGYFPLDKLPPLSRKMTEKELRKALDVVLNKTDVVFD